MSSILQINNLSKRYGNTLALDDFSLNVNSESVYGILGPNGSGKTTTLSIILDVLKADSGSYQWFDELPSATSRRRIGSLLEKPNFLPYLSAAKNLRISALIKGAPIESINTVLELVDLTQRKHSAYQSFSLGMKQRLALASSLLGDPDVLVLDEPTNGLDPQGIFEVRNIIQRIANQGKTVILASHILDEIEKVCTHVAILKNGVKLTDGTTREKLVSSDTLEIAAPDLEELQHVLNAFRGVDGITRHDDKLLASISDEVDVSELNVYLINKGIKPNHLVRKKQTLESHFMEITRGDRE
ncbi:MAG: ATP-binding cassette domain-containing protein [Balneolales bacterium]